MNNDKNMEVVQDLELVGLKPIRMDGIVNWNNKMVEARFAATEIEMRLLIALSAQLDKEQGCVMVSAKDLGNMIHLNSKNAYRELKKIARNLFKKEIYFKTVDKLSNNKPKEENWIHLFSRLTYNNEHSAICFEFYKDVDPLLRQVKEAYVKVPLDTAMTLKGPYTNRMLMNIVQWAKISPHIVSLDDLREQFQVGTKYKSNSEFIRTAVTLSLKQIADFTEYKVKVEQIKTKRQITHLKFFIEQTKTKEVIDVVATNAESDTPLNQIQKELVLEMLKHHVNKDFAEQYVSQNTPENSRLNLDYAYDAFRKAESAGHPIKNKAGYIRKALIGNYGVNQKQAADAMVEAAATKEAERLAGMTPEQRDENEQRKEWFKDMTNGNSRTSKSPEDIKKAAIKREILEVDRESQERFLTWVQSELDKDSNPVHKSMFEILVRSTIDDVLNDNMILGKLVAYTYMLRYSD